MTKALQRILYTIHSLPRLFQFLFSIYLHRWRFTQLTQLGYEVALEITNNVVQVYFNMIVWWYFSTFTLMFTCLLCLVLQLRVSLSILYYPAINSIQFKIQQRLSWATASSNTEHWAFTKSYSSAKYETEFKKGTMKNMENLILFLFIAIWESSPS